MTLRQRMHPWQTHMMVKAFIAGDVARARERLDKGANIHVRLHIGVFNGLEFEHTWHTPLMIASYQASRAESLGDEKAAGAYRQLEKLATDRGAELGPRDLIDIKAAARSKGFKIVERAE